VGGRWQDERGREHAVMSAAVAATGAGSTASSWWRTAAVASSPPPTPTLLTIPAFVAVVATLGLDLVRLGVLVVKYCRSWSRKSRYCRIR
jgi:hypothetical protein